VLEKSGGPGDTKSLSGISPGSGPDLRSGAPLSVSSGAHALSAYSAFLRSDPSSPSGVISLPSFANLSFALCVRLGSSKVSSSAQPLALYWASLNLLYQSSSN